LNCKIVVDPCEIPEGYSTCKVASDTHFVVCLGGNRNMEVVSLRADRTSVGDAIVDFEIIGGESLLIYLRKEPDKEKWIGMILTYAMLWLVNNNGVQEFFTDMFNSAAQRHKNAYHYGATAGKRDLQSKLRSLLGLGSYLNFCDD